MKLEDLASPSFQILVMPFVFFIIIYLLKYLTRLSTLKEADKITKKKELVEAFQVGHELQLINLSSIWVVFLLLYYQSLLTRKDIVGMFTVIIFFFGLAIGFCIGEGLLKGPVKKIVYSLGTGFFSVTLGSRFSLWIIELAYKGGVK